MLNEKQRLLLTEAAERYSNSLTPQAVSYLEGRGISQEVSRTFLLGSVVEPSAGHELAEGMLSIPYRTPAGVVGIKFRRLDEGTPKYLGLRAKRLACLMLMICISRAIRLPYARARLIPLSYRVAQAYLALGWLVYLNGNPGFLSYSSRTRAYLSSQTTMLKRMDVILGRNLPRESRKI